MRTLSLLLKRLAHIDLIVRLRLLVLGEEPLVALVHPVEEAAIVLFAARAGHGRRVPVLERVRTRLHLHVNAGVLGAILRRRRRPGLLHLPDAMHCRIHPLRIVLEELVAGLWRQSLSTVCDRPRAKILA